MEMETIANYGWLLLIIFMVFMTTKIIVNTVRNERNRKAFSKVIKPGDSVAVPVMNDQYSGEVLEVNGDEVKIIVTAPKNRVYPKSK
jgi:preprotein translocase subunit YajC